MLEMINKKSTVIVTLLSMICMTTSVQAFISTPMKSFVSKGVVVGAPCGSESQNSQTMRASSSAALQMGFLDDIGKFFNEMSGGDNEGNDDDSDDEEASIPTSPILSIPAESVKQGGLRLYLTFYLMGMQNTPEKGSWRTSQPDENYSIELYYQDMTGALAIRLLEKEIRLERMGQTPSNKYLMQESVIVQGILDELDTCLTEGNAKPTDRLIQLQQPDALEKARDSISFG